MRRRLGKFRISHTYIQDFPQSVMELLKDVLIVRAESNYANEEIEYTAMSELFDTVPLGYVPNQYNVIVHNDGNIRTYEFKKA